MNLRDGEVGEVEDTERRKLMRKTWFLRRENGVGAGDIVLGRWTRKSLLSMIGNGVVGENIALQRTRLRKKISLPRSEIAGVGDDIVQKETLKRRT